MRIAFVASSVGTTTGGIETSVASLASELSKRHDVSLITGLMGDHQATSEFLGIRVVALPFMHRFGKSTRVVSLVWPSVNPYLLESGSLAISSSISRSAQRELRECDVLSTHTKYDALFFSRFAARRGKPSVFHIQGSKFGPIFRMLDRTTSYVAVSQSSRLELSRKFGIPVRHVVSPGVNSSLRDLTREEHDYILFVARLQRSKGTLEAIRIFSALAPEFPHLELVVAGEGPGMTEMQMEARRLSLSHRVTFLGAVPHQRLFGYYSQAKLLLFPSRSEVYPLVPLEAMAAACPVVASDIPGVAESTGRVPILLPVDDTEGWIRASRDLINNANERTLQGQLGREWARARTWNLVARDYERILGEVCDSARSLKTRSP